MNVFTATFNQCNASFINKSIHLKNNKTILLTPNSFKGSVHLPMYYQCDVMQFFILICLNRAAVNIHMDWDNINFF